MLTINGYLNTYMTLTVLIVLTFSHNNMRKSAKTTQDWIFLIVCYIASSSVLTLTIGALSVSWIYDQGSVYLRLFIMSLLVLYLMAIFILILDPTKENVEKWRKLFKLKERNYILENKNDNKDNEQVDE